MQDRLSYSVYCFDENSSNFSMLYSSDNIYLIIQFYNYFVKKFPDKYLKVSRDLQVRGGALC